MFLEKFIELGAYKYSFGYVLDCNLGQITMFPPATTIHIGTYNDNLALAGFSVLLKRLEQLDTVVYLLVGVKNEG